LTGITEPTAAALQNYNHLTFDDEFNSYNSIDMSNSQSSGFNWYLQNWFSTGSTNSNNVTISNGVLELGGGTGNAALVSAIANSSGGYTGTVIGGGSYMEASILFNPSGGANATCWPAFWSEAIQHVVPGADQWQGQANGYTHFVEADIMEYMNGFSSTQYNGAIHDWSGTYSSNGWEYNIANLGNNLIDVGSIDWSVFHTYSLLWVPQSGNTPGHVTWYFDGHAESSIYWLGPASSTSLPGISGSSFTPSSGGQATETYSVLDSDQLALSLQTDSSWPMSVDWVHVWQASSAPALVLAPTIASFSPDSGVVGDGITNAKTLTVSGTAEANSVVLLYDGTTWLGSASVNSNGAWSFTTGSLSDGTHNFTATTTDAQGNTSAASAALAVMVDTVAPTVTEHLLADTGSSSTDNITSNDTLTGLGDPSAVVHFTVDGNPIAGTATAAASGVWTFTPSSLADGTHTIVASETDAAGNTDAASLTITLDTKPPAVTIGNETLSSGKVTLTGTTAEATDKVSIYDGSTLLGTATVNSDDTWSFTTGNVSNAVHTYTVTATDTAGNLGNASNEAILGSTKADTLVGTLGNDSIIGDGGNDTFIGGGGADMLMAGSGSDTFIFKAMADSTPASHDTIVNFNHNNDTIEFNGMAGINAAHGIALFQGQLAVFGGNLSLNAHSVGYIEVGGNTVVLVNTTNSAETLTASDVHAANMEIVLNGTHLGLASNDFHVV
jgi:Bacterial Ig-like domain/RTX calcium-binding nonapeptide repeat (4 copies)